MNQNLFLKELKRNVSTLIVWTIIITVLISVTMSVYRTFMDNQAKITGMLSLVPKGALQFKGISNFNDLLSVLGFYSANNVIYMMVLGSIYAIVLSSGIILKEEYNRTAEYLMTRPVTRSEIFLSKYAVVGINVFLLNFITSLAGFICMELVKRADFSIKAFLILSLYTLLLNLLFASIGIFISVIVRRPRPVTYSAIGIVLIMYFIYTISRITQSVSAAGYLSPFKYVDQDVVSTTYHLSLWRFAYFAGLFLILSVISLALYRRKDIYT